MSKRGRELKLGESMNDVRQLEGGDLLVLKHSSVNGSINERFSSFVATIYDWVTTITFGLNCGFYLLALEIKICTQPLLSKHSCRNKF